MGPKLPWRNGLVSLSRLMTDLLFLSLAAAVGQQRLIPVAWMWVNQRCIRHGMRRSAMRIHGSDYHSLLIGMPRSVGIPSVDVDGKPCAGGTQRLARRGRPEQ